MTKKTTHYLAPNVKVVEFMIEKGFILSGDRQEGVIEDFKSVEATPQNNQYTESNNWGTFE